MTSREVLDAEMRGALKGFRMGTNQDSDRFNAYFGGLSDAYDALPDEPQAEPVTEPRLLVDLSQFEPIGDWCKDGELYSVTDGNTLVTACFDSDEKWMLMFPFPSDGHTGWINVERLWFTPTHARPVEVTP